MIVGVRSHTRAGISQACLQYQPRVLVKHDCLPTRLQPLESGGHLNTLFMQDNMSFESSNVFSRFVPQLSKPCRLTLQAQQSRALHSLNCTERTSPGSSTEACSIMPMPLRTMRRLTSCAAPEQVTTCKQSQCVWDSSISSLERFREISCHPCQAT